MSRALRALIVDDEGPARSELRYLLEELGGVEVIGEATTAAEALHLIGAIEYDIVFLDIEMPGASGVQLAEQIGRVEHPPAIIFVTAHSQHAVKAFEVAAVDYLVKPVELPRLRQAIERVSRAGQPGQGESMVEPVTLLDRVPVERGGRKMLIDAAGIQHVEASDDYTYVHVSGERYLSTLTMAELEARLAPFGFLRVHRRHLVNLGMVVEIVPMYGGTMLLTLGDGGAVQIPVSRRRVAALKQALGL